MAKKNLEIDELYPSNSKTTRMAPIRPRSQRVEQEEIQPKRVVQKSIEGRATVKKKTMTESIAHTLLGEETKSVGAYILYDVLIPAAKTMIQDAFSSGIEMLLFGETRPSSRKNRDGGTKISYGSFYRGHDRDDRREPDRKRGGVVRGGRFDLDDILFDRPKDADDVLSDLCDLLEDYGQVSVADYFELAGVDGATWVHTKWGWEDLGRPYCTHTRGGYAIVLPKPIELD